MTIPGARDQRISARFSDVMNYASRMIYVPEIHLMLDFPGGLEMERLHRAMRRVMDAEPVLGCRFVPRWIAPYWERLSDSDLDRALLASADGAKGEGEQAAMMGQALEVTTGAQMKGLVLSEPERDRLLLKVSHLVMDAGGVKQLAYMLAETYKKLREDGDYRPASSSGSRSLRQVARQFNVWQLLSAYGDYFRLLWKHMRPRQSLTYPSGTNRTGRPIFVLRTLDEGRVAGIRDYGARIGATINDILVAAYFRALIRQTGWNREVPLRQIATVDLRRYLPEDARPALCNLSADFWVGLGFDSGEGFDATLAKVIMEFEGGKARYFGWDFILGSYLLILGLPFALKSHAFASVYRGMVNGRALPPALTNLGRLDQRLLSFGHLHVEHARVVVPPCVPPAFAIGVSGFGENLDFSAGFYESALPKKRIEELFDLIEEELPG